MKKLLHLLFLLLISVNSFSQSLKEEMTGILTQVGKSVPADQLFLHLDRNLYHAGDTIRFQAYIRDSQTGVIETKSSSLYALLINSNHVTIDSARFRIIYSTVSGWLKVPEIIPLGDYSILAFTSSQMNYSPEFAFLTPIKIDNILPVRDETKPGSRNEDTTVNQLPFSQQIIDLKFLPEGGTFIYGIPQRLAFNAVTSTGRTLEVAGVITNQKGKKITEFRSTPYGPGVVEFTPVSGNMYYATLNEDKFKGMKWPLPSPEKSGVAMRVNNAGNGLIDIILKGREIAGMSYFLTMTMNNILVFKEDVKLDTLFRTRIQTDKIPSGTAYVTLYDSELNPVAERLIFLNEHKKMNVMIGVSSPLVNRGDETELTINTTDDEGNDVSSIVSIAVIDSISGYYNGIPLPEIESAYLFDKEFYNNLPLKVKSQGLKNFDSQSVDVLLMTYGWRKFSLKEVARNNPEKELVNYDYLKICNPGPAKKGRSDIKMISIEGLDNISLPGNNNREAFLLYDSLDVTVRQIMILPDNDPVKNGNPVRIEFPENKDFTDKAKLLTIDSDYSTLDLPVISKKQPDFDLESVIMIEPVTIKAPKQSSKVYVDKNEKMFQFGNTSTMYSKDFVTAIDVESILSRFHPYKLDKQNKKIYLRPLKKINNQNPPALIVMDNNPISGKTYESIASMPASQIASVTVLRGPQAFPIFGEDANGGVVFVTTKGCLLAGENYPGDEFGPNDDLLQQVKLFRTDIEYYVPIKEEVAFMPEFQFRSTILWKSNILIDGSPVKIKYPNNLVKGTAMVFVNGVSFTNLVGSNRYS
ncbi:MAG: hypothetical protein LLG13_07845 [Bacteroidales bacterium]|nr:hypothetical protein [Bacteroidales bacterium]